MSCSTRISTHRAAIFPSISSISFSLCPQGVNANMAIFVFEPLRSRFDPAVRTEFFARRLSSVRYLSIRILRSEREVDLPMGNPFLYLANELACFRKSARRLSVAHLDLSVISGMSQVLHDVEISYKKDHHFALREFGKIDRRSNHSNRVS